MDSVSSAMHSLTVALRSTHWQVSPKLQKNAYEFCDGIDIELCWSKNRFSANPEAIFIQQTEMPSLEKVKRHSNEIEIIFV
jgi:hypothetical protein